MGKVIDILTEMEAPKIIGQFMHKPDGVYLLRQDKEGNARDPLKICASLESVALVRDDKQQNWSSLVRFKDPDGVLHTVPISNELLVCGNDEVIRELASNGLRIESVKDVKRLLCDYLSLSWPTARARSVEKTGWYGDQFVLPDRVIGTGEEMVLFKSGNVKSGTGVSSTLEVWQRQVSQYCKGNSRLLLGVSAAFAGPMMSILGSDSGGINFYGISSTGKSTVLRIAATPYGGRAYIQSWNATINGLEGTAVAHNHCLLILDELGQNDPKQVGGAVYMLVNERGKIRATKTGESREPATWKLLFLSSGEVGLQHHMQSAGLAAKAGQELRLVDVPADAGAGFGMFEDIHGFDSGAAFADMLNSNSKIYYGSPIVAYIEKLLSTFGEYELRCEMGALRNKILSQLPLNNVSGQVSRVAERFAIVGAAGELATSLGITGWSAGDAAWGAITCFSAWLNNRGGSDHAENCAYVDGLLSVLETDSERFLDWDNPDAKVIGKCYGVKRLDRATRCHEYFIFSSIWKEIVCAKQNPNDMARYLMKMGYLESGPTGEPYVTKKLDRGTGEKKASKCYHVLPALFMDIAKNADYASNNNIDPEDIPFPISEETPRNAGNFEVDPEEIRF